MIRSAEEFVELRTSEDPVLYTRAAHDSAPKEVWLEVIDKYPQMKKWVIHNKTIPLTILEILSYDEDAQVRWFVATKRKASAAILERLAADPSEGVRSRVAYNRKTPEYILQRLTNDDVDEVARVARTRLEGRGT